jgi:hypothetical protein
VYERKHFILLLALSLLLVGCSTAPPKQTDDLCAIFKEKKSWYKQAVKAQKQWGSSIPTMMAIIHQESRFVHNARPPRKYYLGFIPGRRPSTAYGYPQAKNETWRHYQRASGNYRHKRNKIGDALMFIGWYNNETHRRNGVAKSDTGNLYLAYHEGHGGFSRSSYKNKAWLMPVAQKVAGQASRYQTQLQACEKQLQRKRFLGIF